MTTMVEAWGADVLAEIDPEMFTDFATVRPQVRLDRGTQSLDRLADCRRVVGVAARYRRHLDARPRAGIALAAVLRADHRHRRTLRRHDGVVARRAPRRRPALPARSTRRNRIRPRTHRPVRAAAFAVRRADRHRRCAPRRLASRRPAHRIALGCRARLCVAGPVAQGRDGPGRSRLLDDRHAGAALRPRLGRSRVRRACRRIDR